MGKRIMRAQWRAIPAAIAAKLGDEKYVWHEGHRLKTALLIDLLYQFISKSDMLKKRTLQLHSEVMRKRYGTNYRYYMDWLIAQRVVSLDKNYSVGRSSYRYKLAAEWKDADRVEMTLEQPARSEHKTRPGAKLTPDVQWHPSQVKLERDMQLVSLKPSALEWLAGLKGGKQSIYWKNAHAVHMLLDRNFHFTVDKHGRCHSNITVAKRIVRHEYMLLDGCEVAEFDIPSAQPLFLYLILREQGFEDWGDFERDILGHRFYDRLWEAGPYGSRGQAKEGSYCVIFGRNRKCFDNQVFLRLYPEVWQKIKQMKRDSGSHKSLAHRLQRFESDFMFLDVIPRIGWALPDAPLLTVHDSVICRAVDADVVEREMNACMDILQRGFHVKRKD